MVTLSRALVVALALSAAPGEPGNRHLGSPPFATLADGFGDLRGVAVDEAGHVYVADRAAGTVVRLATDGRHRTLASGLDRPVGLALDASGRVLVAEERGARVVRLDPGHRRTEVVGGIEQPRWLAVGEDGTVYISARRPTRGIDPEPDDESAEPDVVLALAPTGALAVLADGLEGVQGLALSQDSLVVVTQGGRHEARVTGEVVRIPLRGGAPTALGRGGRLEQPAGVARDRLGALFVTTQRLTLGRGRDKRAIAKLHPDGRLSLFAADLEQPEGLAFDATGSLVVADGHRLLRFPAPAPPTLTTPAVTRLPSIAVSGTAEPDARIDLVLNEAPTPISVVADAAGRFTLSVPVAENATNRLEAVATARHGDGLTSVPARAIVVHDPIAPAVALVAPPANAHVRGTVTAYATASDPSGVASLALTADAEPLGATRPPSPAPALSAAAGWDTTAVPDGAHTLAATAIDAAGNAAVTSRVVVVDNTPPDTEITSGPAAASAPTSATFGFTGSDNVTAAAQLEFAWRLDGGERSPFAPTAGVTVSGLTPGMHTFEVTARDRAGNEDPTPASRAFRVGSLSVTITAPASAVTLPAGPVLVRGTVQSDDSGVSVAVNGHVAAVQGPVFAVQVPLAPGDAVLTATARIPSGATASHSVVLAVSATPGAALRAVPGDGLVPLTVRFAVDGLTPAAVALDADGDGVVDFTGPGLEAARFTYTMAGLYFPTVTATDGRGGRVAVTTLVHVKSPAAFEAQFAGVWSGFKDRLAAGDIPGALEYLSPAIRPQFEDILQTLRPSLGAIAEGLEDIVPLDQADDLAEAAVLREEDGRSALYFIYFRRDGLGRWVIEEM